MERDEDKKRTETGGLEDTISKNTVILYAIELTVLRQLL